MKVGVAAVISSVVSAAIDAFPIAALKACLKCLLIASVVSVTLVITVIPVVPVTLVIAVSRIAPSAAAGVTKSLLQAFLVALLIRRPEILIAVPVTIIVLAVITVAPVIVIAVVVAIIVITVITATVLCVDACARHRDQAESDCERECKAFQSFIQIS